MRLFVAVYPPPEALDDIVAQTRRLRIGAAADTGTNVRLTARSTLHVTVAFLGEVPDDRLPAVQEALSRAVESWRHPSIRRRRAPDPGPLDPGPLDPGPLDPGPLDPGPSGPGASGSRSVGPAGEPQARRAPRLQLGGGGRFGRGRFTVLWVGLLGEVDALRQLAATVRRELRRSRLPSDHRPLRPHLTLARPGDRLDRESLDEDLRTLDGYLGPSWPATELVLVRSHLGPRPTYDRLATWPL
ncbi:RNA 2',3'-cyclic phosphodiesterase [Plantactinospora sp. BC1]|uniref:2'-5' RNA ligase family protein n=1 Tax=Plantactinospora sp. BC1 TaxID=2108470 RepID=UPI000D176687|nr:2'-5' RNA ligase family protein [Plantactinospora sp. BC1]AVT31314.1 RNA 2',3'-cyclic phosphodiesterase [Plantactinospora sp. BC1]